MHQSEMTQFQLGNCAIYFHQTGALLGKLIALNHPMFAGKLDWGHASIEHMGLSLVGYPFLVCFQTK